ncbi:MAG: hypothetical protein ACRBBS_06325 [Thalassovita sp.]
MAFEKYSTSGILLYAVPLYAAPILAGASAVSWSAVPVFAALFAVLILKTRPLPDDTSALALSVVAALILHGALASGLFAVGRGVAMVTGSLPIPVWATLVMGGAATGLGLWRYRWTPERAELDAVLDQTLSALKDMPSNEDDPHSRD